MPGVFVYGDVSVGTASAHANNTGERAAFPAHSHGSYSESFTNTIKFFFLTSIKYPENENYY